MAVEILIWDVLHVARRGPETDSELLCSFSLSLSLSGSLSSRLTSLAKLSSHTMQ